MAVTTVANGILRETVLVPRVGYAEGTPVGVALGQYDVLAGQIWLFVPLTLLVAPVVFGSSLTR